MSEAAAINSSNLYTSEPIAAREGDGSPGDHWQPCVPLQLVDSGDNVRSARQPTADALLRILLVPLRTRRRGGENMRRVVGARRPNLCASLACEKRHNSQAMSVDRHPDRIASTQKGVCAGGAVTLEALRLAQATIPVMDTSVGYP